MRSRFWNLAKDISEDFGLGNARRILDRYQSQIPCFNDDIQGTGCVTLAAMLAALEVSSVKLEDVRVVIFGSGTAGTGIADQVAETIATETRKSKDEASKQIWYVSPERLLLRTSADRVQLSRCIDKPGLLVKSLGDKLTDGQRPFARDDKDWPESDRDLESVIKKAQPHVLIGTSTKPGAFTENVIREMAKHVERPIVFPLSNPTRLHEAKPKDLYEWTDGRALVATGSPFPPVKYNGTEYEVGKKPLQKPCRMYPLTTIQRNATTQPVSRVSDLGPSFPSAALCQRRCSLLRWRRSRLALQP
jgi:malate dehydrogenase (oxaloacetate-decarboxylating)